MRHNDSKGLIPWIGIGMMAVLAILFLIYFFGPYSFGHRRSICALSLRWNIRSWQADDWSMRALQPLLKTNDTRQTFLYRTNLYLGGQHYETVLALSDVTLEGKGFLAGTTNAEIFWIGKNGKTK